MTPKRETIPQPQPALDASPRAPKQVSSEQLLGRAGELLIVHGGRQYRLRVTQNGKLILTA